LIKQTELTDSTSCFNRALNHEMIFVLLARDKAAPHAIREWCKERVRLGKNKPDDVQITEALRCAETMEKFYP
jgi:hypothetical protein